MEDSHIKIKTMFKNIIATFILIVVITSCNQNKKTYVVIETDYGTMKAELYDETPIHKENFIKLADIQ